MAGGLREHLAPNLEELLETRFYHRLGVAAIAIARPALVNCLDQTRDGRVAGELDELYPGRLIPRREFLGSMTTRLP